MIVIEVIKDARTGLYFTGDVGDMWSEDVGKAYKVNYTDKDKDLKIKDTIAEFRDSIRRIDKSFGGARILILERIIFLDDFTTDVKSKLK